MVSVEKKADKRRGKRKNEPDPVVQRDGESTLHESDGSLKFSSEKVGVMISERVSKVRHGDEETEVVVLDSVEGRDCRGLEGSWSNEKIESVKGS